MASGFIGNNFSNKTGEIHGTTGQVNTKITTTNGKIPTTISATTGQVDTKIITTNGKIPTAIPAITTYQGKTTKDIKVTVDNKTRLIYAELTDSFIKQKGITSIWYDLDPKSENYQWLCYKMYINDKKEITVKVAKLPTFTDLATLETNLTAFINSVKQELENKINKKERAYVKPNDDGDDCFTLCFTRQ